jgi:hypothetical protein
MAFWVIYDHLGKLILASLLWSLPVAVPAFIAVSAFGTGDPGVQLVMGVPALILAFGVVLPVMSVGLANLAKELIETKDGSISDMFRGVRLFWRRAIGVGFSYLIVLICLTTSTWFYATKLQDSIPWLGYGISALSLWGVIFVLLTSLLVMPTLVQKKANTLETLKLTCLLVLDNPLLTVGIAVQVVAITATAVFLTPVLFFLYGGVVIVLVSSAYELLARKYASLEPVSDQYVTAPKRSETVVEDEEDDYLNRGFRDFLFPWKG